MVMFGDFIKSHCVLKQLNVICVYYYLCISAQLSFLFDVDLFNIGSLNIYNITLYT